MKITVSFYVTIQNEKAINDELNLLTDELAFVNYSHLLILFWNKSKLYVSQVKTAVSNNKHHQRVTCFCNPLWCSTFRRRKLRNRSRQSVDRKLNAPQMRYSKRDFIAIALFYYKCFFKWRDSNTCVEIRNRYMLQPYKSDFKISCPTSSSAKRHLTTQLQMQKLTYLRSTHLAVSQGFLSLEGHPSSKTEFDKFDLFYHCCHCFIR